ncbi:patatin-like phospholipase family protein [Aquimarina sp. 2201CG5-10]|uniref:patatin-like phospholipase family protein n=1 Tax=Aquimarina callyspongiae TaxID=3098150 RepID=UPI002AB36DA5|nr:patatin-like phospholipase family protein [Aquimarina sp. 2201CG5-10]MDY8138079.1 patatin-like phospholipase family protein [Aquimarina sp. 2201CG5-10]
MDTRLAKFIQGFNRLIRSFKFFYKSSFLSLIVIAIILLILLNMDQAYTMMVYMLEQDNKISLVICFFFVYALALALSHYPIYNYYSMDLNDSKDKFDWETHYPFKRVLKKYPFFIFKRNSKPYQADILANYFRYALGIFIYAVWIVFVYNSFEPNLKFNEHLLVPVKWIPWIIGAFFMVPFVIYWRLKYRIEKDLIQDIKKFYRTLAKAFFLSVFLTVIFLIFLIIPGSRFSRLGLIIMLLITYTMMFSYVFFRLTRGELKDMYDTLDKKSKLRWFIGPIRYLTSSVAYLKMFSVYFIIAVFYIFYCNIAVVFGFEMTSVIPILLAYMYAYYWILANISKYFFAARKARRNPENLDDHSTYNQTKSFRWTYMLVILFAIMVFVSFKFAEQNTHELEPVKNIVTGKNIINENPFVSSIKEKNANTLFFVSSYGGGLKANVWTLIVLNKLQKETQGKFLDHTVAMSGASGGSLGLALYTGLYAEDGKNTNAIKEKINKIALKNYASADLSFALGMDFYRKLWPFTYKTPLQDRSYYSMIKYQNLIEGKTNASLSNVPYRTYWGKAFNKTGYFPSLIMNTSGIRVNRGILWSVKHNKGDFEKIFPYSENLADLYSNKDKTLPFYQAVSTTNRFPVFSPAAKIEGYGHYMDAGAIDNSGLLGNLDVYNHLREKDLLFNNKNIVFVEIINGKELYVDYVLSQISESEFDRNNKDEYEKDNIAVNIKTGLDYNKIPRYLGDFFKNWAGKDKTTTIAPFGKIHHIRIYLPHKITTDDIEAHMVGAYEKDDLEKLQKKLDTYNKQILDVTKTDQTSFLKAWEYYEPTLSRHMNVTSYEYFKKMLNEHEVVNIEINKIKDMLR